MHTSHNFNFSWREDNHIDYLFMHTEDLAEVAFCKERDHYTDHYHTKFRDTLSASQGAPKKFAA